MTTTAAGHPLVLGVGVGHMEMGLLVPGAWGHQLAASPSTPELSVVGSRAWRVKHGRGLLGQTVGPGRLCRGSTRPSEGLQSASSGRPCSPRKPRR